MPQEYREVIVQRFKLNSSNKELVQELLGDLHTLLLGENPGVESLRFASQIVMTCLAHDSVSILEIKTFGVIGEIPAGLHIILNSDPIFDLTLLVPLQLTDNRDGGPGDETELNN